MVVGKQLFELEQVIGGQIGHQLINQLPHLIIACVVTYFRKLDLLQFVPEQVQSVQLRGYHLHNIPIGEGAEDDRVLATYLFLKDLLFQEAGDTGVLYLLVAVVFIYGIGVEKGMDELHFAAKHALLGWA